MNKKYIEMSNANNFVINMFRVFISSKTEDELGKNYHMLNEALKDCRNKCVILANTISETKLKDPPD